MHNGDAQHGPRDEAKRELELRLRQQAVLAELGRRALSHAPFEHLLEEGARLAAVGLTATYAKVLEYLTDQNRLLVRAGVGWEPGVVGQATIGADLDSPADYALHTGKPVISNLLSSESRFRTPQLLAEHGVRRAINVILLSEGRPYGVLEVNSEQPGAFSENDVDFLQGIANLLGVAIERWRSDEELRRLNQELESRVAAALAERRQTEDALHQAQKMEAIGQLTGGVAHDFNNLLLVISGNLELIAQRVANNERLSHLVATAQQGATRGTQLTSQLLAFARRQTLRPEGRSVNELIREVDVLSARILSEAVEMNLLLDPAAGSCFVDPAQFASAALNLVLNARDAMPSGGRLTITTGHVVIDSVAAAGHSDAQPGDYVVVEVADTGSGMSPAVLERATEPFFTTKEPGKGTGLGLSQVYGFLRQSNGFLAIESTPEAGTTVRMYFSRIADPP
jgi:signal transduction histidine kinase